MTRKRVDSNLAKILEREKKFIREEKEKFIESFLKNVEQEFKDYNKGYRILSVTTGKPTYFLLDDKIVTEIANNLTENYKCKLLFASQTFIPSSNIPLYTLTFKK